MTAEIEHSTDQNTVEKARTQKEKSSTTMRVSWRSTIRNTMTRELENKTDQNTERLSSSSPPNS